MIAVNVQRLMNTTTSLGFNFLSIEQSVLEGTVGKSNLVLTYWVSIWLLSEWKHWLLALQKTAASWLGLSSEMLGSGIFMQGC